MTLKLLPVCVLLLANFAIAADYELADPSARVPTQTIVPEYPERARDQRLEGEVEVCFEVTRSGKPRRISVRRSTHRWFEKPAINAVKASRYEPLPDDEELPGIKTCRTFQFTLDPVIED